MQTFKTDRDAVFWTADDGEWVPAHVARGLYDALDAIVDRADREGIKLPDYSKAIDALTTADKGE